MDIYWYGQSCFKVKGKTTTLIIDPYDPNVLGLKLPKDMEASVVLVTHKHSDHNNIAAVTGDPMQILGPGEYDIKGVVVMGIEMYHDKSNGSEKGKNTIYNIQIDGLNIVHLGDLGHTFTEAQVEEIGQCDILMVPVGAPYTIGAKDAAEVVSELEPKIILPMHYAIPGLKVELESVDKFLKEMGKEQVAPQPKLTIVKDKLPEEPVVILLNKV